MFNQQVDGPRVFGGSSHTDDVNGRRGGGRGLNAAKFKYVRDCFGYMVYVYLYI